MPTNSEKILVTLQEGPLTVSEIATQAGLDENNTRVYLNRLKKQHQVEEAGKRGQFKVYKIGYQANLFQQKPAFKILCAGNLGVGKTALLQGHAHPIFGDTGLNIGVEFYRKIIQLGGKEIALQIWDLGDIDQFRHAMPTYAEGTNGAILFYDITDPSTLTQLGEWVNICRSHDKDLPILLCGTKMDLVAKRAVPTEYAQSFLQPLNLFGHVEISAKTGENVENAFLTITRKISERMQNQAEFDSLDLASQQINLSELQLPFVELSNRFTAVEDSLKELLAEVRALGDAIKSKNE
ncbi:MAG TPA: GTP-binding protein [Candidatus Lokiarchaeia archaeon]|nr:GTP-binding protein [Candidatus Lokiarchaeia archaeon]